VFYNSTLTITRPESQNIALWVISLMEYLIVVIGIVSVLCTSSIPPITPLQRFGSHDISEPRDIIKDEMDTITPDLGKYQVA